MNKSLLLLAVGSIVIAAVSFYKLSQSRRRTATAQQEKPKKSKPNPVAASQPSIADSVNSSREEPHCKDREIYDREVTEQHPYRMVLQQPKHNHDISGIQYQLLLSLNKSKGYEGVVKMKVMLNQGKQAKGQDLHIDYAGSGILHMAVNNRRLEPEQVVFENHTILVRKQWLREGENNFELIFANKYAFMGDGLACYFPLDDMNKYSLRDQVIYTRNSPTKVRNIFPCLNLLNPCDVSLQVLHPNGFIAESNTHKTDMKLATRKDYPFYEFLFLPTLRPLGSSNRLSSSAINESNSFRSSEEIVKAKSQFATSRLNSIHDFFVFCSAVGEVRPGVSLTSSTSASACSAEKEFKNVLIRYFCKEHAAKQAVSFVSALESQLIDIFTKVQSYRRAHQLSLKYSCKIDIFFIDDVGAEGDFYSGAILLSEKSIQRGVLDRRLYFLLSRAFVGMGLLAARQESLVRLPGLLKLNELTLQIFPECSDYIFVKNKQYEAIRDQCLRLLMLQQQLNANDKQPQSVKLKKQLEMACWLMDYYEKQSRYFIRDYRTVEDKISSNVRDIVDNLRDVDLAEYWNFFIARYPLIEFNVSEVLIKLSLKRKGVPRDPAELKYAKDNFVKSKYYLKFYEVGQIQDDLSRFIQLQSHGVEKILPLIKIRESHLAFLPRSMEGYIYISQNRLEGQKLYAQFKKYNESSNFHHISALRREIKRIKLLAKDHIKQERRDIKCGLISWKMLNKLMIMPADDQTYELICRLQSVKKGADNKRQLQGQSNFQSQGLVRN